MKPSDIERRSMEIITDKLANRGISLSPDKEAVVLRVIHASADFDYAQNLAFSPRAVDQALCAIRQGVSIVTDTNMARVGISERDLRRFGGTVICYMAYDEVAKEAKKRDVTRAMVSMERASLEHPRGIFAIGNAPTALMTLCDLMEQGLRPSLVIGVPVGFVNVLESKVRAQTVCEEAGVPCIIAHGRKGGSAIAAAICNALIYDVSGTLDPRMRAS